MVTYQPSGEFGHRVQHRLVSRVRGEQERGRGVVACLGGVPQHQANVAQDGPAHGRRELVGESAHHELLRGDEAAVLRAEQLRVERFTEYVEQFGGALTDQCGELMHAQRCPDDPHHGQQPPAPGRQWSQPHGGE